MLLTFYSGYGQTYFIALFSAEIRAEFGLSHGDWGAIYGASTMVSALLMIWVGALADRFRVRDLASVVLAGLALACLGMATMPGLWALPLVILALRLAGQGMCSHLAVTGMTRWFAANRGRALSLAAMGFSAGEALLPLIFVALLAVAPWKLLWGLAAGLTLLALFVTRILLSKERRPASEDAKSQSPGLLGNRHWTRPEALGHPLLWCLLPVVIGPPCFMTALFFHQVHLADMRGIEHVQFVAFLPLYTVVVIATVIVSGRLIDRYGARRTIALAQLPFAAGFLVLALGAGQGALGLAMILLAVGVGNMNTVPAALWAEAYGTRHIGAIKALATSIMVLGSALGPVASGLAIDAGHPLPDQLPVFALWFCLTAALAAFATGRYLRQR